MGQYFITFYPQQFNSRKLHRDHNSLGSGTKLKGAAPGLSITLIIVEEPLKILHAFADFQRPKLTIIVMEHKSRSAAH